MIDIHLNEYDRNSSVKFKSEEDTQIQTSYFEGPKRFKFFFYRIKFVGQLVKTREENEGRELE